MSLEPRNHGALLVPKYALIYLSDHNWKYYYVGLFGEGAIRKRFLHVERFHRGCFFRHEKLVHSVLGSDQLETKPLTSTLDECITSGKDPDTHPLYFINWRHTDTSHPLLCYEGMKKERYTFRLFILPFVFTIPFCST